MFAYREFSLVISSELELPGLPVSAGEPDIVIRYGSVPRRGRCKASPTDELAFNTFAGGFHVLNGSEIVIDPLPGADPEALRAILLGRIMAYLLRQRGWLPLHASGVVIGGRGVLFLGASGAGKSTMATAFHARGHQVITDDIAPVRATGEVCIGLPARPRLRLDENSRSITKGRVTQRDWDKFVLDAGDEALPATIGIRQIYLLKEGDEIGTQAISRSGSVKVLSEHCFFKRQRMDPAAFRIHLRDCAAVAGLIFVRELIRPLDLSALSSVAEFVEKELAGHA